MAALVLGVMFAWSIGLLFYRRRTVRVVVIEVSIAVVGILATMLAETPGGHRGRAVHHPDHLGRRVGGRGSRGGGRARRARWPPPPSSLADLVEVGGHPTQSTVHNIVLVVLLGGLIGLAVDLARTGLEREEQVLLERERLHERERIARVVHDGVLQSLAYIHRRGDEIGGEAAELSVIAAEQERSLRRFVSGTGAPDAATDAADLRGVEGAEVDLRMLLTAHERPRRRGRGAGRPGRGRPARRRRGRRRRRRGPRQRRPPRRPGRPRLAAARGRLGRHRAHHPRRRRRRRAWPTCSGPPNAAGWASAPRIRGRVEDLGGTVTWSTRPGGGCVVRMTVPRTAAPRPTGRTPPHAAQEPR